MTRHRIAFIVPLLLLTACGDDEEPGGPTAEVRIQREMAYRQACVAAVIAAEAEENLALLETTFAFGGDASESPPLAQQTTNAVVGFSRAYQQHSELRATAYAYVDSAINHSAATADSARYMARAASFSIRAPMDGTVEGNVISAYQGNFVALLRDEDHRCNWDVPF